LRWPNGEIRLFGDIDDEDIDGDDSSLKLSFLATWLSISSLDSSDLATDLLGFLGGSNQPAFFSNLSSLSYSPVGGVV